MSARRGIVMAYYYTYLLFWFPSFLFLLLTLFHKSCTYFCSFFFTEHKTNAGTFDMTLVITQIVWLGVNICLTYKLKPALFTNTEFWLLQVRRRAFYFRTNLDVPGFLNCNFSVFLLQLTPPDGPATETRCSRAHVFVCFIIFLANSYKYMDYFYDTKCMQC